MKGSVLVTCVEAEFGKCIAEVFRREGFQVFTADDSFEELDFLVDTTDFCEDRDVFCLSEGIEGDVIERTFRENVIKPMATLEKYLPFLDKGEGKRLFYLSSARASINETHEKNGYAYKMSKAALHQFLQMVQNRLAPNGYTLRIFDPMYDSASAQEAAESAFNYITRRRGTENDDPLRDDENILALRDAEGRQHCW